MVQVTFPRGGNAVCENGKSAVRHLEVDIRCRLEPCRVLRTIVGKTGSRGEVTECRTVLRHGLVLVAACEDREVTADQSCYRRRRLVEGIEAAGKIGRDGSVLPASHRTVQNRNPPLYQGVGRRELPGLFHPGDRTLVVPPVVVNKRPHHRRLGGCRVAADGLLNAAETSGEMAAGRVALLFEQPEMGKSETGPGLGGRRVHEPRPLELRHGRVGCPLLEMAQQVPRPQLRDKRLRDGRPAVP